MGGPFGPGCPGVRCAAVLRTAPVGRALPILAAYARFQGFYLLPRPTLRPTSFRFFRRRGAPVVAPIVAPPYACCGSSRCVRTASATVKPTAPARLNSAASAPRCCADSAPFARLSPPADTTATGHRHLPPAPHTTCPARQTAAPLLLPKHAIRQPTPAARLPMVGPPPARCPAHRYRAAQAPKKAHAARPLPQIMVQAAVEKSAARGFIRVQATKAKG